MSIALLIARLYFGLGLAAHGAQKLFGWYGGHGLAGTGEFIVKLGFPWKRFFTLTLALAETSGGLLVALGLLGPVGPAIMIAVMIVAVMTVHVRNGFFAARNGVEIPMLYAMGALVLAFTGPGDYSVDRILGLERFVGADQAAVAVGLGLLAAVVALLIRRLAKPPADATR
jgi:putative oxidoreductase